MTRSRLTWVWGTFVCVRPPTVRFGMWCVLRGAAGPGRNDRTSIGDYNSLHWLIVLVVLVVLVLAVMMMMALLIVGLVLLFLVLVLTLPE